MAQAGLLGSGPKAGACTKALYGSPTVDHNRGTAPDRSRRQQECSLHRTTARSLGCSGSEETQAPRRNVYAGPRGPDEEPTGRTDRKQSEDDPKMDRSRLASREPTKERIATTTPLGSQTSSSWNSGETIHEQVLVHRWNREALEWLVLLLGEMADWKPIGPQREEQRDGRSMATAN